MFFCFTDTEIGCNFKSRRIDEMDSVVELASLCWMTPSVDLAREGNKVSCASVRYSNIVLVRYYCKSTFRRSFR